jgi:hypothetical protein
MQTPRLSLPAHSISPKLKAKTLSFVLLLSATACAELRKAQIASFVAISPQTPLHFSSPIAAYTGGVLCKGSFQLWNQPNRGVQSLVSFRDIKLTVDPSKFTNKKTDYDSVAVKWQGKSYELETSDTLLEATYQFVANNRSIAFTISDPIEEKLAKSHNLVAGPSDTSYIVAELKAFPKFLERVDVDTEDEDIDKNLESQLIKNANGGTVPATKDFISASYTNSDSDVTYRGFFSYKNNKYQIITEGLPLRYYWGINRKTKQVQVFKVRAWIYPETPYDTQHKAILFYQTVAFLRQLKNDNPVAFQSFGQSMAFIKAVAQEAK